MSDPADGQPLVSVVIPTFQRAERCVRLLRALGEQTLDPALFEVITVDDGSGDASPTILESVVTQVPYRLRPLRMGTNRGPAAARNRGWQSAEASVVAFIDDDCLPTSGWLAAGLAAVNADERIGVIQGRTTPPEGVDVASLPRWWHHHRIDGPTPRFEGCNIFYRRQAIAQGGGFSEEIAWWGEDTAAGWRVIDAGWRSGFTPEAWAFHEVAPRGLRWHVRNGFAERNVVRLAREHPGFRAQSFWRPWAYRREDAAFILALVGVTVATRHRSALLTTLPYLWCRRPGSWGAAGLRTSCECLPVDAARAAGQLWGALRYRVAIL